MSEHPSLIVLSSSREDDQARAERLARAGRVDALGVDRSVFVRMPCFRMSPETERGEERVQRWKREESLWMSEAWLRWMERRDQDA